MGNRIGNAYLSLIVSAILYGSISTIAKPSLNTINPILLSSLIYLIIGIFLTLVIRMTKGIASLGRASLVLIFLDSLFGAVIGPLLYFYGLRLTSASTASLLINVEFLFSILFAVFILREKPHKIAYAGIGLIFVSLIVVNLKVDTFVFFQPDNLLGNGLIISSTIFWALDNNISKVILQKGIPITRLIQIKPLFGGLLSLGIVILLQIPFTINGVTQIPPLLFLSLGGFAGSLFLFLKGMREVGTTKSVMIFSTSSIFGIFFAAVFLKESVEIWRLLLSISGMMIGIYLITRNNK